MCLLYKSEHPQLRSATPQHGGQPYRLQSCRLKKVLELRLRTLKTLTSAILHRLLLIPLLSSPFSSAQDSFKNQPKIFLRLSVSLKNKKGQLRDIFISNFFFHEWTGFHGQKYDENCGSEAFKLRSQSNISLKSCGIPIVEVFP